MFDINCHAGNSSLISCAPFSKDH